MKRTTLALVASFTALLVLGSVSTVYARDGSSSNSGSGSSTSEQESDDVSSNGIESTTELMKKQREALAERQKEAEQERIEAEKEHVEAEDSKKSEAQALARDTKLAEAKKKVCENRRESIKKIIERTGTNGQHHLEMITKVYENVKSFISKKSITVPDYATLVANVDTAKTAAEKAIADSSATGTEFNCETAAPKSAAEAFLAAKKAQAAALKAYRDAVKQLLVAAKSAASATTTETDGGAQ